MFLSHENLYNIHMIKIMYYKFGRKILMIKNDALDEVYDLTELIAEF